MLQAAEFGKDVIRILCDDTDVFVMLVYHVHGMEDAIECIVQMKRWNGIVLDINATCTELGPKCVHLLGMHALFGCDALFYPFNKGKMYTLNAL
jgi:hypothetical protein